MSRYLDHLDGIRALIAELSDRYRVTLPEGYVVEPERAEHGGGAVYLLRSGQCVASFPGGDGNHFQMEIAELNALRRASHSGPDFHAWDLYHLEQIYERRQ